MNLWRCQGLHNSNKALLHWCVVLLTQILICQLKRLWTTAPVKFSPMKMPACILLAYEQKKKKCMLLYMQPLDSSASLQITGFTQCLQTLLISQNTDFIFSERCFLSSPLFYITSLSMPGMRMQFSQEDSLQTTGSWSQ